MLEYGKIYKPTQDNIAQISKTPGLSDCTENVLLYFDNHTDSNVKNVFVEYPKTENVLVGYFAKYWRVYGEKTPAGHTVNIENIVGFALIPKEYAG